MLNVALNVDPVGRCLSEPEIRALSPSDLLDQTNTSGPPLIRFSAVTDDATLAYPIQNCTARFRDRLYEQTCVSSRSVSLYRFSYFGGLTFFFKQLK